MKSRTNHGKKRTPVRISPAKNGENNKTHLCTHVDLNHLPVDQATNNQQTTTNKQQPTTQQPNNNNNNNNKKKKKKVERKQHLTTITAWVSSYRQETIPVHGLEKYLTIQATFLRFTSSCTFLQLWKDTNAFAYRCPVSPTSPVSEQSKFSYFLVMRPFFVDQIFIFPGENHYVSQIHRSMQKWPMPPNKQKLWDCLKMRYTGIPWYTPELWPMLKMNIS